MAKAFLNSRFDGITEKCTNYGSRLLLAGRFPVEDKVSVDEVIDSIRKEQQNGILTSERP
jgi:hypothetical protein